MPSLPEPAAPPEPLEALLKGDPDVLAALDAYAADATGHPSRAELVERILRDWLESNGYLEADPAEALAGDAG